MVFTNNAQKLVKILRVKPMKMGCAVLAQGVFALALAVDPGLSKWALVVQGAEAVMCW